MSDNNNTNTERKESYGGGGRDGGRDYRGGGGRGGYSQGGDKGFRSKNRMFFKRKVCKFCVKNLPINYKEADVLKKFTTERGKIIPRRITGTCAKHQRKLTRAIKRARVLAFLPFVEKNR